MAVPLSLLDLAQIGPGETARESFTASVELARRAESLGLRRVWYAEHHNMGSIASSATSVLIAHVANHTTTIRLGAGGVMLPNHSPLVIAEQFGTLETLHPGRIDLGLGRAPGSDQQTMRALRRDERAAERFPDDVRELRGYLSGPTQVAGVTAVPGAGTNVPLYILGSSLFGAGLAAELGLPYAFASHFAPSALQQAVTAYRARFRPSEQLAEPYVIAGVNVIAAETTDAADARLRDALHRRARLLVPALRHLASEELDIALDSSGGRQIEQMLHYTAVGTPEVVVDYLAAFADHADADELIIALADTDRSLGLESLEATARAHAAVAAAS